MGNQLTGVAPSQILPVEQYLTDIPSLAFEANLGSTRFFKVAKARNKEGLVVVKVFVIHDPSLPLRHYKDQLDNILNELQGANNCLPFERATQSDRAALLFRQYVKDSLYDRISTRPFLNATEKRWIAFQLLCALNQCHMLNVCHGDIKSENVMVTSWNWILLTDFASFKPTYLPEDNPADFSYFFDTSRRRTCYIAPERFVESPWRTADLNRDSTNIDLTANEVKTGDLMPSMDIFSAGCVITELFTEGTSPFDLSQLLAYRAGEYTPNKLAQTIEDVNIRELVIHMMQRDPAVRWTAERYLVDQRGKAFPEYFYTFLRLYCQRFASTPILYADERVNRIKRDLDLIFEHLKVEDGEGNASLVIVISLLTSSIRELRYSDTKLTALQLMMSLSRHVTADIVLDRLVPYMLLLVGDEFPRVRCEAIRTLTQCLSRIRNVPKSDANIFPEYILPYMATLTLDPVTLARGAFAESIAVLADNALRFLEMVQVQTSSPGVEGGDPGHASYDAELRELTEIVQQKVATLLSDPDNLVKQTLMTNGITRLCVFFGQQKANDILLSHMITFLNDKRDWLLRGAFFDSIVGVATCVGWQSSVILKPLLQQGLTDSEEFVIVKTLKAVGALVELGLLLRGTVHELLRDVAPFLVHPNVWIKHGAVGFFAKVARKMLIPDIHCHLLPQLLPFLKEPIVQFDDELILLSSLLDPLPRQLFDNIAKFGQLEALLDHLQKRHQARGFVRHSQQPTYPEPDDQIAPMLRKLVSQGLTVEQEQKAVALANFIVKQQRQRTVTLDQSSEDVGADRPGTVNLARLNRQNICQQINMSTYDASSNRTETIRAARKPPGFTVNSPIQGMNPDWQQMFGAPAERSSQPPGRYGYEKPDATLEQSISASMASSSSTIIVSKSGATERSHDGGQKRSRANCRTSFIELQKKKYHQYVSDKAMTDQLDSSVYEVRSMPPAWKPQGLLVAHLHEHRGAVNRIRVSHDQRYFATCSNDGTVKMWDCRRLEGKSITNRSCYTYGRQGGQIKTLCFCDSSQSLASASDSGAIHVFRTEPNASRISVTQTRNLDVDADGLVVDMTAFDSGSQNVIAYTTVNGLIVGWDIRAQRVAWRLQNSPRLGLVTSFDVHHELSWLVLGTSDGAHICWDMRFQLPVNTVHHPNRSHVRRCLVNQSTASSIVSSVQGNNEIDFWDVETNTRQRALWASKSPVLSTTQSSPHCINGIQLGYAHGRAAFVIAAGNDMRIRFWDLVTPGDSQIVVPGADDTPDPVVYESRLIDGTEVIFEGHTRERAAAPPNPEDAHNGLKPPPVGHLDIITDVSLCHLSQYFIVTASRDGMVKAWK